MQKVKPFEQMDEQEFLEMFEQKRFPFNQWRHRPHVTVAYLYLRKLSLEEAIDTMRDRIQAHNAANGLMGAYHETLTQVWARIIYAIMATHGPSDSAKNFFDRHTYLLNKMLPLMFYTHQRIMSKQARDAFLEPDLMPLPTPPQKDIPKINYDPDSFQAIPPDPVLIIASTTQIIEYDPNNVVAYFQRGENHLALKNFEQALRDYKKVIALNLEHSWAYYKIGAIYALQNEPKAALENLQKSLELAFPLPQLIGRDPYWDNIRENKMFQKLVKDYSVKTF